MFRWLLNIPRCFWLWLFRPLPVAAEPSLATEAAAPFRSVTLGSAVPPPAVSPAAADDPDWQLPPMTETSPAPFLAAGASTTPAASPAKSLAEPGFASGRDEDRKPTSTTAATDAPCVPPFRSDLFAPAYSTALTASPDPATAPTTVTQSSPGTAPGAGAQAAVDLDPGPRPTPALEPDSADDLLLLTNYLLFGEFDPERLEEASRRYLLPPATRALSTLLRDRILEHWCQSGRPLDLQAVYALAVSLAMQPAAALQLCYNVSRAFADGSRAIPWAKIERWRGAYSTGRQRFVIPSGATVAGGPEPSLLPLLFRSPTAVEPADWHRYFACAWLTYAQIEIPARASAPDWFSGVHQTFTALHALDRGETSPGCSWANAIVFYECSRWGRMAHRVHNQHRAAFYGALLGFSLRPAQHPPAGAWKVPHPGTSAVARTWPIATGADKA